MSKKRKSIENILIRGGIAKGVNLCLIFGRNILIIPILLSTWGVEKYGLWVALFSFFQLLMSLDDGHSQFICNEFGKAYYTDKLQAQKILGSSIRVTYLSGFAQVIILILVWYFGSIDYLFPSNLQTANQIAQGIGALILFRFLIGSTRAILIKSILPLGYIDRSTYLKTTERAVEILILIYAGIFHLTVVETCFVFAIFRFFYSLFIILLVRKWMPDYYPWWKFGNIRFGMKNYLVSLSLTLNFFVDRFSKDGLNLLISSTLGLIALPVFTTTKTIINFATMATNLIISPLQPEIVRFNASKQYHKIIEAIKANWLITNIIICIPFLIGIFFIEDFYQIWTDGKLEFNLTLFALMAISILMYNYGNSYMAYLKSLNHIKALLVISVTRSAVLLVLSYVLINSLGLVGIAFALIATELLTSVNIPYFFSSKELGNVGYKISWKDRSLSLMAIAIVSIGYFAKIKEIYHLEVTIISLIILAIIVRSQWKLLDKTVKQKFQNFIPSKKLRNLFYSNRG